MKAILDRKNKILGLYENDKICYAIYNVTSLKRTEKGSKCYDIYSKKKMLGWAIVDEVEERW